MIPEKKILTYMDYLRVEGDYELINGVLYAQASPSPKHQAVSRDIANLLDTAFECTVLQDVDLLLPEKVVFDKVIDCVRPDIMVICDKSKIKESNIQGSPDLIVEILSPINSSNDSVIKRELYEKNKVQEYWMIDCQSNKLFVLYLENNIYRLKTYENDSFVIINDNEILFKIDGLL